MARACGQIEQTLARGTLSQAKIHLPRITSAMSDVLTTDCFFLMEVKGQFLVLPKIPAQRNLMREQRCLAQESLRTS